MGVTVSFEGSVRDAAAREAVVRAAREFALSRGWQVDQSDNGVVVLPHDRSEPIAFEFDDLETSGSAKTQFAGASLHWQVIELLRQVQPLFATFHVDDDAEAWDGASREEVEAAFALVDDRIAELRDAPTGMHPLLQTFITGIVMVALLIAGGFAYSWWVGLL